MIFVTGGFLDRSMSECGWRCTRKRMPWLLAISRANRSDELFTPGMNHCPICIETKRFSVRVSD